jgi:hypothetical protein
VLFSASPAFWKVNEACLLSDPSRDERSLCFAFRRFWFWLIPFPEPPEPLVPCWRTVTTVYPLGNCDSLKVETFLSYLTRLGAVSISRLAAQFLFRVY